MYLMIRRILSLFPYTKGNVARENAKTTGVLISYMGPGKYLAKFWWIEFEKSAKFGKCNRHYAGQGVR